MLLINLLLLPVKLVLKLVLYTIGFAIHGLLVVLTVVNGIISGIVRLAGSIIVFLSVIALIGMFWTIGFDKSTFITGSISVAAVVITMFLPDLIQYILIKVSNISAMFFKMASFKLFTRNHDKFATGE